MHRKTLLLAILAGFLGALAGQSIQHLPAGHAQENGSGGAGGDRIGFVDIKKVFERYAKTREAEKAINDGFRQEMTKLRERAAELKKVQQDVLPMLAPNSPERRAKERELALAAFNVEFEEKWLQEKVKNDLKLATEKIYDEIVVELGKYADLNGYRAVFKVDEEEIESVSRNELKLKIHTRTVLFHRKSEDLTEPFIDYLNKK